jgi:hypothetical protein
MKTVQDHIYKKQQRFISHAFFRRLESAERLEGHMLVFAKALTFWVMAFQDILYLNEALVTDPILKRIARHHKAEDSGHDKWFMADLLVIEGTVPSVSWLFSAEHVVTRTASYALISEVYRASTDYERIALLLSLESTGHIFFQKIVTYFERMEITNSLQYFARKHLEVEKQHELFEERLTASLFSTVLAGPTREACCNLIDRIYSAFDTMFISIDSASDRSRLKGSEASKCAFRLSNSEAACKAVGRIPKLASVTARTNDL